jgi:GNAT superfamily N-acetyltransferase
MNDTVNAFHRLESNFFSMIAIDQLNCSNLVALATGVHAANLNPALVHYLDDSFSANIETCKEFYSQQQLPWALILPEHLDSERVEDLLKSHSLAQNDKGVAMVIFLKETYLASAPVSLTVKAMDDDLHLWSVPLLHGFESTPEITEVYTNRHQSASKSKGLYHFSGFVNDTVVCSLSLSCLGEYARIDDVATMPEEQRKGYASQLINAALNYARARDVNTCFLEASSAGLNVYKRLGFKELFKNHYYESQ